MSADSMLAMLAGLGAKATLVFAIALAADLLLLRRTSAAARHLLWSLALGAVLLLPAFAALLPAWRVTVDIATPRAQTVAPTASASIDPKLDDLTRSRGAGRGAAEKSPEEFLRASSSFSVAPRDSLAPGNGIVALWRETMLALYLVGIVLLLVRVALDRRAVQRLARASTPVDDVEWTALARTLAASLGVRRRVTLLKSADRTMPLTWGLLRPCVLLPVDADAWPMTRRRAVLLHELAHVARHDCLTQTLAAVACAFYWPHPGAWWAAARLRDERELACDDRALAQGVAGGDYAGELLELARTLRTPRALAAAAVTMADTARRSHLERRLRAAIDRTRDRTAPGRGSTTLAVAAALALVLPLSAFTARASEAPLVVTSDVPTPASAPRAADRSATVAPAVVAQAGEWHMRMATANESPAGVPTVHVMFVTNGINTFTVPLARLEGLAPAHFAAADTSARFTLRRDAGTFTFDGRFRAGQGKGRFEFAPDPAYGDALARRGIARPTAAQQWTIAQHGVELSFLDVLAAHGYAMPSPEQLARTSMTGVDDDYVREMAELGYRLGRVEALVRLSNQGVDPAYVRALAAMGYERLAPESMIRLRNAGLDADEIRRLNALAGRRLSVDELPGARRRIGAVPAAPMPPAAPDAPAVPAPDSVPPRGEDGGTPLGGRWVVHATRNGWVDLELFWDDGTNWRRWYRTSSLRVGDGNLALEQDAGTFELTGGLEGGRGRGALRFTPHREFVATLRTLGIRGAESTTDHNLKNLAWGEISAATIRELQEIGYRALTLEDIQAMGIFEVTSRFARTANAGESTPIPVNELIDLRRRSKP